MIINRGTTTIETERLILRKFNSSDIESCFNNWLSDKKSIKFVDCNLCEDLKMAEDFIMDIIYNYNSFVYCYAIVLKKTGEVIGSLQLININYYIKKGEIGFILGSKYWGKGYMSEALKYFFSFAFETLDIHRIEGLCTFDNVKSQTLMLNCGMIYEGTLRKIILIRELYHDGKIFSILKDDFNFLI